MLVLLTVNSWQNWTIRMGLRNLGIFTKWRTPYKLDNSKLGSTQHMLTLTCYQDHILTENIWFVWSETSYSGDKRRCHYAGRTTNEQLKIELLSQWKLEAEFRNTNAMKYKYKIMRCHLKYKCKYNEMQIQNVSEFESKTTTGRHVATSNTNTNESEAILCSDVSAKGQSRTSS